ASGWKQVFTGVDEAVSVTRVSLIDVFDAELTAAISKAADEFQSSLNLSEGPLMRAVLFDFGEERPGRLLLVIHHLLVDGGSWRILLEDLHIGYEHLRRGEEIKFPPRTTSFKRWSERLNEYAQSAELRQELSFWLDDARASVKSLPVDFQMVDSIQV